MNVNTRAQAQPYRAVLFDLDGTLTDPAEGILRCAIYALERINAPAPDEATLRRWIGPPLRETLNSYLGSPERGRQALHHYRERFAHVGLFENQLYPGIPELLSRLQADGCKLLLATAKPQPYAQRILEHFALLDYFDTVGGATLDGRISSKADVIATVLPRLTAAERTACVMVGDREHDILGARSHNLATIAVSYGYGSYAELASHNPLAIAASVTELSLLLTRTAK